MKHFRHYLDAADTGKVRALAPELTPTAAGTKALGTAFVVREPVGVVAAITPYNYPYFLNVVKVAAALVTGNTVVLKPSPYTPFEALVLAGALMGGDIECAVREVRAQGLIVVSLNMAGSVPQAADLVVTDPIQAGVMTVMAVAETAKFRVERLKNRVF